jgi:hypothetical protein
MGRRGQSVTLSISERDKAQLEQMAIAQGMLWGDRPNISRLVEAIARGELLIGRNNDWPEARLQALHQAIRALTDAGHPDMAQVVAQLLVERNELPIPLKTELERFLETSLVPWRVTIGQYIQRQQPFRLTYQDAAERLWNFTIHYARIVPYERRQYLECWCEETEGSQDLPELQHNRTLRLDRISDAALTPVQGKWRSQLDGLDVELHLFNGLALAYEAKTGDSHNAWIENSTPPVRRVVRRVSNLFWFYRDLLRYGEDCLIVSPASVQQRFQQKLQALYQRYAIGEHNP